MTLPYNILVRRPEDISVQWAQRIARYHAADAEVSAVDVQSVDVGTSTRMRVVVEHDVPHILPKRWFVKLPSMVLKARVLTTLPRFLHREVNFYCTVSNTVPVRLPPALAAQSRWGLVSTLVLTDVTEFGAIPGKPSDALSREQSRRVVEHLAHFHARFWGKTCLVQRHPWLAGSTDGIENHLGKFMAVPLMKRGLKLAGDTVPGSLHQAALHYAHHRHHWTHALMQGPKTLVHHDCHPGNLFWMDDNPGFLDWQLIRMGEGISDIAYFLATALDPECRRAYEKELLALYLTTLDKLGVRELDEGQLYQRYRAHLVYPLEAMILTMAIGDMMERTSNIELIRRASAAVEDHDAFAALTA